jgi:hypothetical protein
MANIQQWIKDAQYYSTSIIDSDNIPMFVVLLILLVFIVIFEKPRKWFVALGVLWSLLMLGIFVKPNEMVSIIPWLDTKIVMTRELGNDSQYTMYLSTSDEEDEIFTFNMHEQTDLESWLSTYEGKDIYLRVDKGSVVIYDKILGKVTSGNSEALYNIYEYWVDNGIVPEEKQRYKLWKFYLDV